MTKRVNPDDPDDLYVWCEECEGSGEVSIPADDAKEVLDVNGNTTYTRFVSGACPDCDGSGMYEGDPEYFEN